MDDDKHGPDMSEYTAEAELILEIRDLTVALGAEMTTEHAAALSELTASELLDEFAALLRAWDKYARRRQQPSEPEATEQAQRSRSSLMALVLRRLPWTSMHNGRDIIERSG